MLIGGRREWMVSVLSILVCIYRMWDKFFFCVFMGRDGGEANI